MRKLTVLLASFIFLLSMGCGKCDNAHDSEPPKNVDVPGAVTPTDVPAPASATGS